MAIRKVLVVDDSKTELMFMTDLLQKNGFAVKTAASAEDAFRVGILARMSLAVLGFTTALAIWGFGAFD